MNKGNFFDSQGAYYIYNGYLIYKGNFFKKAKYRIFFLKCNLCMVWSWFREKITLILQKYLFWGYLE